MPRFHSLSRGRKIQFTAEEEAAWDAQETAWADDALARAQEALRSRRNQLLAETDWMASSDLTMSDNWKTYRQALRDLPSGKDTVEKCENATWPTKPS